MAAKWEQGSSVARKTKLLSLHCECTNVFQSRILSFYQYKNHKSGQILHTVCHVFSSGKPGQLIRGRAMEPEKTEPGARHDWAVIDAAPSQNSASIPINSGLARYPPCRVAHAPLAGRCSPRPRPLILQEPAVPE